MRMAIISLSRRRSLADIATRGYDQVSLESNKLAALFARVSAPVASSRSVSEWWSRIDGTAYHLAVFGDMYSEWRFQWWSDSPPQWNAMVQLANEMLDLFSSASNSGG